jgi:hypothetical protein
VLFCGHEFHDGYALTAAALAGDARFAVTRCTRDQVEAHVTDADMAVRVAHAQLPPWPACAVRCSCR